jgi:hypothetical protein
MGLYLLIPTLIVVIASVLIVRAGAIALRMTGLDDKTASFQALSAFTRAGFTTRESEMVVSHPQRRAIISWLIVLGNAGIVAVIVTATSSLTTSTDYRTAIVIVVLLLGVYLVYRLARLTGLTRRWESLVENRLIRGRFLSPVPRTQHLLRFVGGYGVARMPVVEKTSLSMGPLRDKLTAGGFIVLGLERQGQWIPNPLKEDSVDTGDSLILYGSLSEMEKIFQR